MPDWVVEVVEHAHVVAEVGRRQLAARFDIVWVDAWALVDRRRSGRRS